MTSTFLPLRLPGKLARLKRRTVETKLIQTQSIQVGKVVTQGDPNSKDIVDRQWTSAFNKQRVDDSVEVLKLGIVGDSVADSRFHGGVDKAMLCYAASHYDLWATEFPDLKMSGGALGENLTLSGATESTTCIGDTYEVGSCRLQVSQPRQPCWKISRRWGVKTLTKHVGQTGRTGWYVRVLQEGKISAGDEWKLTERPHENWSVARANDILMGREIDRMALFEMMNMPELADAWKKDLP